jgi:hypothetical protein
MRRRLDDGGREVREREERSEPELLIVAHDYEYRRGLRYYHKQPHRQLDFTCYLLYHSITVSGITVTHATAIVKWNQLPHAKLIFRGASSL